jgi:type IV pilus assembly protein PilM
MMVAVRHTEAAPRLEAAASAELPRGALHGHVVRDPAAVAHAVRALGAARWRWPVVTAVPASAVMMRRLAIAADPGSALDAAVVREAATIVPDGLERVVLDYQVLEAADGVTRVLAVAARSELVRSYTAALRGAGLDPCRVDVDLLALHRVRRACPGDEAAALVHVGARTVSVAVVRDDLPDFTGDVPAGPDADVEPLAVAVARMLEAPPTVARTEHPVALLCGGSARIPGFAGALARHSRWTVETLDPFAVFARRGGGRRPGGDPASFGVAVGLALRCLERPWW